MKSQMLLSLAVSGAGAPQAAEPQLLDVDGTLFINLGLFFITMWVLNRFLWRPYLKIRDERNSRVAGYRDEAARIEAEAEARLAKVEAQLNEAKRVASLERAKVRSEAQAQEARILAEAQATAQKTLAEARTRVEAALTAAKADLEARAVALSREIGSKVLGRGLS